jgi:hypothetical protein
MEIQLSEMKDRKKDLILSFKLFPRGKSELGASLWALHRQRKWASGVLKGWGGKEDRRC